VLKKLWAFVLKAGTTPLGKAIEHAAVAAGTVVLGTLVADAYKGGLTFPTVRADIVAGVVIFGNAVRAYLKATYGTPAV